MSKRYASLLSPVRIGNTVVKNRFVYPNASPHFLQGPETFPAEGYISFVSGLAKNGAGLVTLAEWANYPQQRVGDPNSDMTHMQAFDLSDPAVHNYISAMADEVHFYGGKLLLGGMISFPEGYSLNGGPGFGPPGMAKETKRIPKEMLPQAIDEFVAHVRLYKNMGFDGFTTRVDGTMNAMGKERDDEYGGSVENRMRFTLEAYAALKKAFGPGFITEMQLAGEQPLGYTGGQAGGYTLEDTIKVCKLAEGIVDIVQLREKDMCKSHPTGFTFSKGEHDVVKYSMAIKAAGCKILTEPIGGFQDPDELEEYIKSGKCDMIGMARGFMADPEYGKKLLAGKGEDVTPCLFCNKCHGVIHDEPDPWISVCSVNPTLGITQRLPRLIEAPERVKKVAVIGGGPTGMRAAIYAARRGHKVTLFEKTGVLGGQLIHSDSFAFKWPVRDYKNWLVRQLGECGVEVRMNYAPTAQEISAMGFDAVLAATGAKAVVPHSIEGLRNADGTVKADTRTCVDVFGREAELGKRVVVVGGSETGIETAMYLADNGHDVTVLTRQSKIGHDCSRLHYITMAFVKFDEKTGRGGMAPAWEAYDNIHGVPSVTTKSVDGGKVTYVDESGKQSVIEADSVVICGGMSPCVDEALSYSAAADEFYMIGDCNGAGNLQRCNRDAFSKASLL